MTVRTLTLSFIAAAALAADFPHRIVTSGQGYFPVAIHLKNGDVLAVLRGGAPHIGVKGRLDLVRSTDGGNTWSAPWTAIDESLDDRNPALGQLKDGTIVLGYAIASGYDETGLRFKADRKDRIFDGVYLIFSKDGHTWTKPARDPVIYRFYAGQGHVSPYGTRFSCSAPNFQQLGQSQQGCVGRHWGFGSIRAGAAAARRANHHLFGEPPGGVAA